MALTSVDMTWNSSLMPWHLNEYRAETGDGVGISMPIAVGSGVDDASGAIDGENDELGSVQPQTMSNSIPDASTSFVVSSTNDT